MSGTCRWYRTRMGRKKALWLAGLRAAREAFGFARRFGLRALFSGEIIEAKVFGGTFSGTPLQQAIGIATMQYRFDTLGHCTHPDAMQTICWKGREATCLRWRAAQ